MDEPPLTRSQIIFQLVPALIIFGIMLGATLYLGRGFLAFDGAYPPVELRD